MSRIEQALQKVAQDKKKTAPAASEPKSQSAAPAGPPPQSSPDPAAALSTPEPLKVNNPMLITEAHGAVGPVAEEYKKMRSLVVKLTTGDKFQNTIMVTSTLGEEGKSLTAANLALTLAREYDHTVLLIDTDLRRPSLHKQLGVNARPGLIQCLKEDLPISQALVKTGLGKMVFLPSGGTLDDPVEVLSSNQMKNLIAELKNRYPERYVIFDTPPILPFADAQVLAPSVDGTIFVVREGRAKVKEVKEALKSLHGSNLLGVVYNDAQSFVRKKHYYYY